MSAMRGNIYMSRADGTSALIREGRPGMNMTRKQAREEANGVSDVADSGLEGPVAKGDLVINWYDANLVAYGGEPDDSRLTELSFGLFQGGPPVLKCAPDRVAPAGGPGGTPQTAVYPGCPPASSGGGRPPSSAPGTG